MIYLDPQFLGFLAMTMPFIVVFKIVIKLTK